jgi:hypothetical protein
VDQPDADLVTPPPLPEWWDTHPDGAVWKSAIDSLPALLGDARAVLGDPNSEELIHTVVGTVPARLLTCKQFRQDTPGYAVLVNEWWLGVACVKRKVDALALSGAQMGLVAGALA